MTEPDRRPEADVTTDVTTVIPPTGDIPDEAAAAVQQVPAAPVKARRSSGARWGIALLVTALVLGVTSVGLVLMSAATPTSPLTSYVPAGSFAYLEVRLDAPGDQRQNIGNVLSTFPGFADQANLGFKIDEALDLLLGQAVPRAGTFSRDIHPWLGDSIAAAGTRLPTGSDLEDGEGGVLVLVATKDPAATKTYVQMYLAPGAPTTSYNGVELTRLESDGTPMLVGVVENVLLAGDEASVQSAIDTQGASTFAASATFKAATSAIAGDRLVLAYLDLRQVIEGVMAQAGQTPQPSALLSPDALPSWVALVVRAEPDALTATIAIQAASLGPINANHESGLAPHLPATTLAAVELHSLGDLILTVFNVVRESAEGQEAAEQIDQALRALGGAEDLFGWIGDGTVALVANGTDLPDAGVLIRAKDAEQASDRLIQLNNLVSLVGGSSGLTISEETYGADTITIYDLGAAPQAGDGQVPIAIGDRLTLAVVQREDLVVVGIGSTFVKKVLDTGSGESLASEARYKTALDRAGASNAGQIYVDVVRMLDLVVAAMPADDQALYRREIAPYLEPLQAAAASAASSELSRLRFVVTVK